MKTRKPNANLCRLECQNCGKVWDYKGYSMYYATCPQCKYNVRISKSKTNKRTTLDVLQDYRNDMFNDNKPLQIITNDNSSLQMIPNDSKPLPIVHNEGDCADDKTNE